MAVTNNFAHTGNVNVSVARATHSHAKASSNDCKSVLCPPFQDAVVSAGIWQ